MNRYGNFLTMIGLALIAAGCVSMHQASLQGDFDKVRDLIAKGESLDQRGAGGETPIMAAAKANDIRVVELLLFNGADIHLKDDAGHSALWYAYHNDADEVFKLLLEKGAKIDFNLAASAASMLQHKMSRLAEEYVLYRQIMSRGSLVLFDQYMMNFPRGAYIREVEAELKRMVETDYNKIKYSESLPELESFLAKYGSLGRNIYVVTAKSLNIRAQSEIYAEIVGSYQQGEQIHVKDERFGWLQTDKGWISGQYVRRVSERHIPLIRPYILNISHKIDGLKERQAQARRPPQAKVRQQTKPEQIAPPRTQAAVPVPAEPIPETQTPVAPPVDQAAVQIQPPPVKTAPPRDQIPDTPAAKAQRELDAILENPTLDKLRDYLDKYKNDKDARQQFLRARQKYMTMLMGE